MSDINNIKEKDKQYYMGVFGERLPVIPTHGKGAHLFDDDGNEYIDFLAGIAVNCLGYSDEGLINTVKTQAEKLIHISNLFYIPSQTSAAEKLCKLSGYAKVFFANSGAEANEGAIKLARKHFEGQGKYEFITMLDSFHGRTLATLAATGQERFHKPFYPLVPEFKYAKLNDIDSVGALISEKTCGVIIEPIIGEGGVMPADKGFMQKLRALCDEKGILLIADEIQCGNGRTGKFLAMEHFGVSADITTLAKGIGGGVPVGAFLAKKGVCDDFCIGDHGSTFGGNPLATAAVDYVAGKLLETDMIAQNAILGEKLKEALLKIMAKHSDKCISVQGLGLMIGMRLEPSVSAKDVMLSLLKKGVIIGTAGNNCLRFVPPYVISEKDIDLLASKLDETLSE